MNEAAYSILALLAFGTLPFIIIGVARFVERFEGAISIVLGVAFIAAFLGVFIWIGYTDGIGTAAIPLAFLAGLAAVGFIIYMACVWTARGVKASRRGVKAWSDRCAADAKQAANPFRVPDVGRLSDADVERIADAVMKRKADEG